MSGKNIYKYIVRSERIALGVRGPKGNGLESEFSVWDYLTEWGGRAEFRDHLWSVFPCSRLDVGSDSACWNHCCERAVPAASLWGLAVSMGVAEPHS